MRTESRVSLFLVMVWLVVGAGALARMARYLGGWPLWGDETALAVSFAQRNFTELAQPLPIQQVAPVGYLWIVKTLVNLLGFNVYSLRLASIAAGLACLPLVYRICRRSLRHWHWGFPLAVFAASSYAIRHAAEVKQYAFDAFWGALLVALGIEAVRGSRHAWLVLLLISPLAIFCSHPAVFVAGGLTLAMLFQAPRRQDTWLRAALHGAVTATAFGLVYLFFLRPQMAMHLDDMGRHWQSGFVDFSSPAAFLGWLVHTLTGVVFAIPYGGKNLGSLVPAILFWIGVVCIWRHEDRALPRIMAATVALALVAAMLRKYPFGGHARIVQYLVPLFCVPIGVGLAWFVQFPARRFGNPASCLLGILLAALLIGMLYDCAKPCHGYTPLLWRRTARWFWIDYRLKGKLHCADAAWRRAFPDVAGSTRHYACYRELYAPDVPELDDAFAPDAVGPVGPVGLVVITSLPETDRPYIAAWIQGLMKRHEILRHDVFPTDLGKYGIEEYHVVWVKAR